MAELEIRTLTALRDNYVWPRADQPALQAAMGAVGDPVATFAEIRRRKDVY